MSMKPYTLSGEQVEALFDLLMNIRFEKLAWKQEVVAIGRLDGIDTPVVIKELFYDDQFGIYPTGEESE